MKYTRQEKKGEDNAIYFLCERKRKKGRGKKEKEDKEEKREIKYPIYKRSESKS